LAAWVAAAGYQQLDVSSSTWTFADGSSRTWWGGLWAERTTDSSFARQALEHGFTTKGELELLAEGWREWSQQPDAVFVVVHVEVLGRA